MNQVVIDVFSDLMQALKRKQLIIFCGAGISRSSGVPCVKPFLSYLLGPLGVPESIHSKFEDIPFEMVMQTLIEHSRGVEDTILDIYDLGQPNTTHLFFAELMNSDKVRTIVTTNFDELIERSLYRSPPSISTSKKGEGVIVEYQLLYSDEHFENCPLDDGQKKLIKIHGSYQDKASMVITIKQIAQRDLSANRRNLVRRVFTQSPAKDEAVLVLGYSCSDIFDINECIASVSGAKKRIYFIQHDKTEKRVEEIGVLKENNPFSQYPGKRIYYDTDKFIAELWKKTIPHISYKPVKYAEDEQWKNLIRRWFDWNSDYKKDDILGGLFFVVREYQRSIQHYKKILNYCRLNNEHLNVAWCLHNIGLSYDGDEDSMEAIKYYEEALRIAKQLKNKELAMVQYGSLADAWMKLSFLGDKECSQSMRYYKKALRTAKSIKDRDQEGHLHSGIASVYIHRKLDAIAIPHLQNALDIAHETGNKGRELTCLGNMATAKSHLGEYEEAVDYYEQAAYIANGLGDISSEVQTYDNIKRSKEKKDAPNRFEESMRRMGIEILDESQIQDKNFFTFLIIGVIIALLLVCTFSQHFG